MKNGLFLMLLLLLPVALSAQEDVILLYGKVTSEGKGVSYASLHLAGTSIGVSCNDGGLYELKLPVGHEMDTVIIRSIGYKQEKRLVRDLMKRGDVKLEEQFIVLQEVKVKGYRTASTLILAAVRRIKKNFHKDTTYSTFFYRDWRSLDGELFLLDEAVMRVKRAGYGAFSNKQGYAYCDYHREMETDYKDLLKHRLVVYDRRMLEKEVHKSLGVFEMLEYSDNAAFFDPVATPQASYMLAERFLVKHTFDPVREFEDNGELFYLVRSVGPSRVWKSLVNYEYVIRKKDLAIVRITSSQNAVTQQAPQDAWVNVYYNRMIIDDTSSWTYEVRDGHYTLTHYYNNKQFHLYSRNRGHDKDVQHWQLCVDWTMTDFSMEAPAPEGTAIAFHPQALPTAFGKSDNILSSFWENYNSILIDTLPLKMLEDKLKKRKEYQP